MENTIIENTEPQTIPKPPRWYFNKQTGNPTKYKSRRTHNAFYQHPHYHSQQKYPPNHNIPKMWQTIFYPPYQRTEDQMLQNYPTPESHSPHRLGCWQKNYTDFQYDQSLMMVASYIEQPESPTSKNLKPSSTEDSVLP